MDVADLGASAMQSSVLITQASSVKAATWSVMASTLLWLVSTGCCEHLDKLAQGVFRKGIRISIHLLVLQTGKNREEMGFLLLS